MELLSCALFMLMFLLPGGRRDAQNVRNWLVAGTEENQLTKHANKWSRFSAWTCNTPQVRKYGRTSFHTFVNETRRHFRVFVFGGISNSADVADTKLSKATWIYNEEMNYWSVLDNLADEPPALESPHLVTVCNHYVILLHPHLINHTWIFVISNMQWMQTRILPELPNLHKFVLFEEMTAIAVNKTNCSCLCCQSVLLFPCGNNPEFETLYEFSCVSEAIAYTWKQIRFQQALYPVKPECKSFASSPSKDMVFAMVGQCLWLFSVKYSTWERADNCTLLQTISISKYTFGTVSPDNLNIYLLFDMKHRIVKRINVSDFSTSSETIVGTILFVWRLYFIHARNGDQVLFLGQVKHDFCQSSMWALTKSSSSPVWVMTKLSDTELSPSGNTDVLQSVWNQRIYLLVYRRYNNMLEDQAQTYYNLWYLYLPFMVWKQLGRVDRGVIVPGSSTTSASTFLGNKYWLIVSQNITRILNTDTQFIHGRIKHSINNRTSFSMVTVNGTSALLFGGKLNIGLFDDLWLFSSKTKRWTEVEIDRKVGSVPPPRFNHAAAIIRSQMFIYGGRDKNDVCYDDLWKFDLSSKNWSIIEAQNQGPNVTGIKFCIAHATAQSGHLWISVGCGKEAACKQPEIQIWMFIIHLRIWERLNDFQPVTELDKTLKPLAFWQGYLFRVATPEYGLSYIKVGCPLGLVSKDISEFPCDLCEIGYYPNAISEQFLSEGEMSSYH
ncbi:uncharacterized protein LOC134181542 [Corticium candelabrum]|uniref:uncharacterized protein LOC134181542 n=1 Tax=Corticium candelabrum TaxID=121492 RepID=UPI002E267ADC|nr:uncharacterized protein LOC134181542 [Corticium candelabrum]